MYLTPSEIKAKYGIDPTHVKRDLMMRGARTKEYIFCNRKCYSYYEPDVQKIIENKKDRKKKHDIRYDKRPDVIRGIKSELKKVIDNKLYVKLRNAYYGMLRRCYTDEREDYHNYREHGIRVCDEWLNSFDKFALWAINNGVEENLTLDRINNNGNYEPSNCRWVSRYVQNNNKAIVHTIRYNGEEKTISDWAAEYGIKRKTLAYRLLVSGWSVEKSLTTPTRKPISSTSLS